MHLVAFGHPERDVVKLHVALVKSGCPPRRSQILPSSSIAAHRSRWPRFAQRREMSIGHSDLIGQRRLSRRFVDPQLVSSSDAVRLGLPQHTPPYRPAQAFPFQLVNDDPTRLSGISIQPPGNRVGAFSTLTRYSTLAFAIYHPHEPCSWSERDTSAPIEINIVDASVKPSVYPAPATTQE